MCFKQLAVGRFPPAGRPAGGGRPAAAPTNKGILISKLLIASSRKRPYEPETTEERTPPVSVRHYDLHLRRCASASLVWRALAMDLQVRIVTAVTE